MTTAMIYYNFRDDEKMIFGNKILIIGWIEALFHILNSDWSNFLRIIPIGRIQLD